MAQTTETLRADIQDAMNKAAELGSIVLPDGAHLEVIDCNGGDKNDKAPQTWKIRMIGGQVAAAKASK